MTKLKIWMRVVGGINLLLGLANTVLILTDPQNYSDRLPFSGTNVGRAFADAWMAFALDLVVVGVFLLWAANRPEQSINVVWLVIWLELFHGVVDDAFLISRGYSPGAYLAFIVVHLAIIVTGILAVRGASSRQPSQEGSPASA